MFTHPTKSLYVFQQPVNCLFVTAGDTAHANLSSGSVAFGERHLNPQ